MSAADLPSPALPPPAGTDGSTDGSFDVAGGFVALVGFVAVLARRH